MTDKHPIPDGAVLVAIDIAKARNDVLIEIPGRSRRRRLTVPNIRDEHDRFIELLLSFDRPVVAGFEATGNYHRAIAWRLLEAGVEARLISSMALARTLGVFGFQLAKPAHVRRLERPEPLAPGVDRLLAHTVPFRRLSDRAVVRLRRIETICSSVNRDLRMFASDSRRQPLKQSWPEITGAGHHLG
jgi:hypothetical protein